MIHEFPSTDNNIERLKERLRKFEALTTRLDDAQSALDNPVNMSTQAAIMEKVDAITGLRALLHSPL